ncbi:pectinesterase-like [Ananas comosus]|uniref:Pectinesterase n=1 Tax=Ananas comosus TaxID=4615 RepID=A0A6P5F7Q2_ANACO|nr:pectinesterase-like [Ananas comosus]
MSPPSHDLLLLSPPTRKSSWMCKLFLFAALVSVTGFAIIHSISILNPIQLSDLCTNSPNANAASCSAIVSDAAVSTAAGDNISQPDPVRIFTAIVNKSLYQLDVAAAAVSDVRLRINEPEQQSALSDCMQLMDLSRDRLAAVAGGAARCNARTWVSAVLTNYGTCRDGLRRSAKASVGPQLESLNALASAALAVLNAVSPVADDDVITFKKFPSWLSHHDRKILEGSVADGGIQADVIVAKDGSGKFATVQEAVDAARDGRKSARYVIYVKKGVYKENVNIGKTKKNVMIVGDGKSATVITGSRNVIDGSTTFNSATLAAVGDGLILQDLKIENTAGPKKQQAVALRVGADKAAINPCSIDSYQDTLYAHSLCQFYRDSHISGTIDFIFGNAAVVIQNCQIIARKPLPNQENTITAQGREDPNQSTATSIQNCQVLPGPDLSPVKKAIPSYLGRPWKAYSKTLFMQSFIDDHIAPKGWLEWNGDFALKTLFYGEYQNRGPGAGTAGRVRWPRYHVITDPNVAKAFTVAALIQGGSWLPGTGVAFTEGL